jgi:UPF0755 protein
MQGFHDQRAVRRAALLLFFSIVACIGWLLSYSGIKGPDVKSESVIVTIPHGASLGQIGHILGKAGLIHDDIRFLLTAKITGYSKRFKAGEFRLATGGNSIEVMRLLSEAQPVQHAVTIAEGLRAEDIARIYAEDGWCDYNEFLHLVHEPEFIKSLAVGALTSLEGYLYPDTYYLTRMSGIDARSLIKMMVQHFRKIWAEISKETKEGIGEHEAVILASVVEKETADPAERPMIASVFYNRLHQGMRLQSDPTVIYGIKKFSGNLTRDDLQRYTPYNTYVTPALPIGPICNPGKEALKAVLFPAKETYLYFVSRNDGTHQFSKSLSEHNLAVQKYQRQKNVQEKGK